MKLLPFNPKYSLGLLLFLSIFLFSCSKEKESNSEALTTQDLQILQDRQEQKVRTMWVMANQIPLFVSLPTANQSQADVFLMQGDKVRVLDETIYTSDLERSYLYVQNLADNRRGYIPLAYLIDETYAIGMTTEYTTHYFQPDRRFGASSAIFVPAYRLIFSNDSQGLSPFVAYKSVDLLGNPLEGYLERKVVHFSPQLLQAHALYQRAFFSDDWQTTIKYAQQIQRDHANTPFAKLASDLLDLQNMSALGKQLRLFARSYPAHRAPDNQERAIPIYSKPHDRARVLGYLTDDRRLTIVAGYGENQAIHLIDSPYAWYLIDRQGWVPASAITLEGLIEELHFSLATPEEEELAWLAELDQGDSESQSASNQDTMTQNAIEEVDIPITQGE
ncbi:hypothetical protein [Entomospira culicis]|uniref:SH3 domain-containing protein n=1 Tax=Entomospira culicis TaxID=2719989 RepID=A0A968GEM1_9SPIO|nr:hypothetical protein [Entomospira culicis]NIZ18878.1 hypothetical protein [Entomospira culicis]NIZ69093.1 hypothetical protein [Entomospira culicis]WDI37680.1 hypothetical protein PVA46_02545 [Entomospira culicis]WDI39308.1 hypothetical protein PVA47_02550 [Entomospira culicis]